jgi:hypothetical protein
VRYNGVEPRWSSGVRALWRRTRPATAVRRQSAPRLMEREALTKTERPCWYRRAGSAPRSEPRRSA